MPEDAEGALEEGALDELLDEGALFVLEESAAEDAVEVELFVDGPFDDEIEDEPVLDVLVDELD